MRLETATSRELVSRLKKLMPSGVVFKHCDMLTKGIPDISVSYKGRTIWSEAKYIDDVTRISGDEKKYVSLVPKLDVDGVQWELLRKMGNGYLVVYTDYGSAFTHVNGCRTSVSSIRLRLYSLESVAMLMLETVKASSKRAKEDV